MRHATSMQQKLLHASEPFIISFREHPNLVGSAGVNSHSSLQ